jgi:hypothetical protein
MASLSNISAVEAFSRNHASRGGFLHDGLAARAPTFRPGGSV